ncbi:hypothetical protein EMCRGX_G004940 [Ephydatia muelleri]
MAGISRSATLVIAYLMQYYGLPMQQAYQFVKDKRPTSSPNLNFMGQLVEFDRIIKEHKLTQFLDISAYIPTVELEIRSSLADGQDMVDMKVTCDRRAGNENATGKVTCDGDSRRECLFDGKATGMFEKSGRKLSVNRMWPRVLQCVHTELDLMEGEVT